MTPEQTRNFLNGIIESLSTGGLVKLLVILGLIVYGLFSIIVVRQVAVMSEAIEDDYNLPITLFAWANLLIAIFLIIGAFVIL